MQGQTFTGWRLLCRDFVTPCQAHHAPEEDFPGRKESCRRHPVNHTDALTKIFAPPNMSHIALPDIVASAEWWREHFWMKLEYTHFPCATMRPKSPPLENIYARPCARHPLDSLHGSHLDIADLFSLIVAAQYGYVATGSSLAVIGTSYIADMKS